MRPPRGLQLFQLRPLKSAATALPTKVEKLEAHASHLLDAFIALRERYALLEPMLFHEAVPRLRGSREQARGFKILRHSLFLSTCQDIAKLSLDTDPRTPSIRNLMLGLGDPAARDELRERFSNWHVPLAEEETDPQIVEALRQLDLRETAENRSRFDQTYLEAITKYSELSSSAAVEACRTVRDKISAHTEVRFVADKYKLVDIAELGLKWGDLRTTIDLMQIMVANLGLLIRNAGFAWDMLDDQLKKASAGFWLPNSAGSAPR